MSLIKIDHHPSKAQLCVFGGLWLVFFGLIALVVQGRGGPRSLVLATAGLAVLTPACGWVFPNLMRLVYLGMAYIAYPVGLVVSLLLLAGVYYLVITPVGLVMKTLGHDPLKRAFERQTPSYWTERMPASEVDRYFRQT